MDHRTQSMDNHQPVIHCLEVIGRNDAIQDKLRRVLFEHKDDDDEEDECMYDDDDKYNYEDDDEISVDVVDQDDDDSEEEEREDIMHEAGEGEPEHGPAQS